MEDGGWRRRGGRTLAHQATGDERGFAKPKLRVEITRDHRRLAMMRISFRLIVIISHPSLEQNAERSISPLSV